MSGYLPLLVHAHRVGHFFKRQDVHQSWGNWDVYSGLGAPVVRDPKEVFFLFKDPRGLIWMKQIKMLKTTLWISHKISNKFHRWK